MAPWHEQDDIWALLAPLMFTPQRLDSAQAEAQQMVALMSLAPPAPFSIWAAASDAIAPHSMPWGSRCAA